MREQARRIVSALSILAFLGAVSPMQAAVTTPQRSLRALGGRAVWVPICSRRGVNGSAAWFDNANTAIMDQVGCYAPAYAAP